MSNVKNHRHFIQQIIDQDNLSEKFDKKVHTRFPPEPNGYLHIGHAKSICLNFSIADEYNGKCNLRFDDTNPVAEEDEYVQSIKEDVKWLGFDWGNNLCFASDYFNQMYEYAIQLINSEKAFVCDLTSEEVSNNRGTLKEPGKESPYRNRAIEENLDLFKRMKNGEFSDGSKTLRAKIDMSHSNINMRDPVMYRIVHARHYRTGDKWCIYPLYDFAHGQSDALEGVTHSVCTLEFENNRPRYDWFLDELSVAHPRQIEFARLNLSHTVLSKRKLGELVAGGHVSGWDDPRMPTLSGMRRRGYTPTSLRNFCETIGVAKRNTTVDMALLEHIVRKDLNSCAPRVMGVLRPLRVVLLNYPEEKVEHVEAINNPEDSSMGTRSVPFSRVLYLEKDDFNEDPPKKFYRLAPGREVRLRYAYFIRCENVVHNPETGEVEELHCTYDPSTLGGMAPDGRKVKATLHWVSAAHSVDAEIRLYERLFSVEEPSALTSEILASSLNPESLQVLRGCKLEPSLAQPSSDSTYQFERQGYFCVDSIESSENKLVFNRTVALRDTWARIESKRHAKRNN